jgi:hypothetical protein
MLIAMLMGVPVRCYLSLSVVCVFVGEVLEAGKIRALTHSSHLLSRKISLETQ